MEKRPASQATIVASVYNLHAPIFYLRRESGVEDGTKWSRCFTGVGLRPSRSFVGNPVECVLDGVSPIPECPSVAFDLRPLFVSFGK